MWIAFTKLAEITIEQVENTFLRCHGFLPADFALTLEAVEKKGLIEIHPSTSKISMLAASLEILKTTIDKDKKRT